jgi:hypothetical protein
MQHMPRADVAEVERLVYAAVADTLQLGIQLLLVLHFCDQALIAVLWATHLIGFLLSLTGRHFAGDARSPMQLSGVCARRRAQQRSCRHRF